MKSVLREFIRESLIQERVGRSTFGFSTLKPGYGLSDKYFDIADAVTDFLTSGSGDIYSWLLNKSKTIALDAKGDITSVLKSLSDTISSGLGNLGRLFTPAGLASLGTVSGLVSAAGGVGVGGALIAGGGELINVITDFLNNNSKNPDGSTNNSLVDSLTSGLSKYFGNMYDKINDDSIVKNLLLNPTDEDFTNAWPKIQTHYDNIVTNLLASTNYESYFANLNMYIVKADLDNLIKEYKIKNDDSAYKALAYAVLVHDTATTFLPKAIIKDVSVYKGKMTPEQEGEVTIYLQSLENRILNNANFQRIQSDFDKLSKL